MAIDMKKLLSDTLIEMSKRKPLAKITVQDLCKELGCSRQSFYNHFIDKDDLIIWTYQERAIDAFANFDGGIFNAVKTTQLKLTQNFGFFSQAIRITGVNSLREFIYEDCVKLYETYIIETHGPSVMTGELKFAIRFYAHGVVGMLIQQLTGALVIDPEEKTLYAISCMPAVLRQWLSDG